MTRNRSASKNRIRDPAQNLRASTVAAGADSVRVYLQKGRLFPASFWLRFRNRHRLGSIHRVVVSEPLLDGFALRQWGYALPAGAASLNVILGHQITVRIVNVNHIAGLGTLAVKGISDIGVVMVLH
jgi:hypothetical protein